MLPTECVKEAYYFCWGWTAAIFGPNKDIEKKIERKEWLANAIHLRTAEGRKSRGDNFIFDHFFLCLIDRSKLVFFSVSVCYILINYSPQVVHVETVADFKEELVKRC